MNQELQDMKQLLAQMKLWRLLIWVFNITGLFFLAYITFKTEGKGVIICWGLYGAINILQLLLNGQIISCQSYIEENEKVTENNYGYGND